MIDIYIMAVHSEFLMEEPKWELDKGCRGGYFVIKERSGPTFKQGLARIPFKLLPKFGPSMYHIYKQYFYINILLDIYEL